MSQEINPLKHTEAINAVLESIPDTREAILPLLKSFDKEGVGALLYGDIARALLEAYRRGERLGAIAAFERAVETIRNWQPEKLK